MGTGKIVCVWNSAIQQVNNWIHMAGIYWSTVVLHKVHMAFFNRDYFGEVTTRENKYLLVQFTWALEMEFERALQFHDEGYESSNDYDLPKLLIRSTHIYLVSSAVETSFNSTDYQESTTATSLSTPKPRQVELPLHWAVCRWLAFSDTPLLAADSNNSAEEEDSPTAVVWSEEPIPDRQICTHMALDNSGTGYFFQLPPPPQKLVCKLISPEWQPMDDIGDDILDLIDRPEEMLFSRLHITTLGLNYTQMLLKDTSYF